MRAPDPLSTEKVLNRGVTQLDRVAAAPNPEEVAVDGRSLAQLLAFAARFGALVRFYDLDDRPNGDWTEFFALDPAIASAVHGALDLPEIERELYRLLAEIRNTTADETCLPGLLRLIGILVRLLGILDRTWRHDTDPWAALGRQAAVDRQGPLAAPLRRLHHHLATRSTMLGLDGCWRRTERDWVKHLLSVLEDVILGLLDELRHGLRSALEEAEEALTLQGHAPQAALYDAFAVLFDGARREMNRFPRRLLDFYYGGILRQESRTAKPAQLFLTFLLATGADEADIPKGTLFSAGTDPSGQAIYYAADTSLEVTPAAVTKLSVHRVVPSDRENADSSARAVVSGVVAASKGTTPAEPFPMFGSDSLIPTGSLSLLPATIGFGFATRTLTLAGGSRTVSINLFPPPTQFLGEAEGLSTATVLQDNLTLYYTAAGAWVPIQDFTVTQSSGQQCFTFTFTLPPDAPALVPLGTLPAADIKTASLPASAFPSPGPLPAILAQCQWQSATGSSKLDAFAILSKLQLDSAAITVTVTGLAPQALSTSGGAIDASQNFPVFGLVPTQNSDLRLSVPELFLKRPSSLSVTIDWAGLPVTSDGFSSYYKGYQIDADGNKSLTPLFDNRTFTASLGVISAGEWTPSDTPLQLFQTNASSTAGSGSNLEPSSALVAPAITASAAPAYYDPSSSLLCVTLAEPSYAFGNVLYSSNLTAATTANIAALRSGGADAAGNAAAQLSRAAAANASTDDKSHSGTMTEAVKKAASALNGSALSALQKAVAASGAGPAAQSDWLAELEACVADKVAGSGLWNWLTGGKAPDAQAIAARLTDWLQQHEQALSATSGTLLQQAKTAISAQGTLLSALKSTASQSVAAARATLSAAFEQAQTTLAQSGSATSTSSVPLPNPPWLPMASAVTVGYTASTTLQTAPVLSAALATAPHGERFYHLDLFDEIVPAAARPSPTVAILPHIDRQAALYIELSPPARQVSLLFILQAGPDGWSSDPPILNWEQRVGLSWRKVTVLADGTNNLLASGIVTLQLHKLPSGAASTLIRVHLMSGMTETPYVKSVTANAVSATWVGPGGAEQLGEPLPAGTVTTSKDSITGLGTIDQPEDSQGGIPPATGKSFDLWMAERLRHKGFAVDGWDYARHALTETPILWQVAVVPATDATGTPAPGHVWVVAVGGPQTPNVSDKTEPIVSPEVLSEVGETLASIAGPFVTVDVTNPPYRRVTVVAEVAFGDEDTVAANTERLDAELVKWLSPWPAPELGPRPDDYYTRQAIADFISRRSYVKGVASLRLKLEKESSNNGWYFLTSALKHKVHGKQDDASPSEEGAS